MKSKGPRKCIGKAQKKFGTGNGKKKFWLKVETLFTFVRNLGGIYLFDKKHLFQQNLVRFSVMAAEKLRVVFTAN